MQKKEGMKPASGGGEVFLTSHPLEWLKTPSWNVGQTLHSSKVIPKVIYYIVLYSINIVVGIISSSRSWKMRKLPTHQRKKEPQTGGQTLHFSATWG